MTSEEAIQELEVLRGIADSGESLAPYRGRIDELYWQVCGKHLRQCKCKNVMQDALVEIYSRLRRNEQNTIKRDNMAQARLVMGVVVFHEGKHYTNKNLTDDVARAFLEKFPMRKDWFEVLPSATSDKAVVAEAEVAENKAEAVTEGEKAEKQATAPKAKKSAKKRK